MWPLKSLLALHLDGAKIMDEEKFNLSDCVYRGEEIQYTLSRYYYKQK